MTKTQETNVLLLFRTVSNSFQDGTPSNDMEWIKQVSAVFCFLGPCVQSIQILGELAQTPYLMLTKSHRLALASILFK